MKAAQVEKYGGIDAIKIHADVPEPTITANQVLVEVRAVSLNRIDSSFRNGHLQQMMPLSFPFTLGGDFAGIVAEVGEAVSTFKKGDEVYGNAGHFKGGSGSLAEFTAANAANTALKPTSISYTQAAAFPLVGATALEAIEERIHLKAGQKILIQGGSGGVGSLAIQLAKIHGAYVATTVSANNVEFAKSLGADEVIDYTSQDVTEILKDYDAVFDTAGGEKINELFKILKKGGVFVTVAGQFDPELAKQHEITAINQITAVSTEQLTKLAGYIDNEEVMEVIEQTFPFTQIHEAFEYFETQHPRGNIVVELE